MTAKNDPVKASEAAADKAQSATDKINEQGFLGEEVDKTPNENYTIAGVTAGKPTPETTKGD
ncbi:hypothetical protein PBI_BRIDGETTE_8 [Arthrobacter phage Bridgette]|uniref:Uncharacterized protein n=1 Tax=Arthrobacter phage Bridgette TaxID=2419949 RepID=A0A3G2KEE6_9CAUD|nr:hypothetical protein HOU46_gp08 [Arthrobacter phage Bridgette]AYN57275.1 hypothetical protein PBI_BRIDGETTE_8 [Arthrobacter phage Bridgette]